MIKHRDWKNIQPMMVAEGDGVGGSQEQNGGENVTDNQAPAFDYEKLAGIIQGKQAVAEDTILKNYFKQQGLSQPEAESAIAAFKQQKTAQQPDVAALQQQVAQAEKQALQAMVEKEATMTAIGLGIDVKTVPYVLKLADLSGVMDQNKQMNQEALDKAIHRVLEDVPALKPSRTQNTGFVQVGASGGNGKQATTEDALKSAFGL